MANSVVVSSSAKLSFTFAKFKMAARAMSVRELDVLKWCSDHMNVSHSPSVGLDD
jgi:hypothetical protein